MKLFQPCTSPPLLVTAAGPRSVGTWRTKRFCQFSKVDATTLGLGRTCPRWSGARDVAGRTPTCPVRRVIFGLVWHTVRSSLDVGRAAQYFLMVWTNREDRW